MMRLLRQGNVVKDVSQIIHGLIPLVCLEEQKSVKRNVTVIFVTTVESVMRGQIVKNKYLKHPNV